jgi:hypothetical protein
MSLTVVYDKQQTGETVRALPAVAANALANSVSVSNAITLFNALDEVAGRAVGLVGSACQRMGQEQSRIRYF